MNSTRIHKSIFNSTLLVVGLGFCVDAFDLFLYNALRVPSLRDLGLEGDTLTKISLNILNLQVAGMLMGGVLWGILGDKIGRKKALLGSVFLYSFGSLGCAVIWNVELYAVMRFLTGIGLAGEIGLGAVLVAETVADRKRDWGITLFTLFAYIGIGGANIMAHYFSWRTCYAIGGAMGFGLLLGRIMLFESSLYENLLAQTKVPRGSLKLLLKNRDLLKRWLCCIFFTMPYFYVVNLLVTLAPEFAQALGVPVPVKANTALMCWTLFAAIGSVLATYVSGIIKRRLWVLGIYLLGNLLVTVYYLTQTQPSAFEFYAVCSIMGLLNFFVLLLFVSVEQFGTNMRATAGTSALSIGRSTLVITNIIFLAFRAYDLDILTAAGLTAAIIFPVGFACLLGLRETYNRNIDFLEKA